MPGHQKVQIILGSLNQNTKAPSRKQSFHCVPWQSETDNYHRPGALILAYGLGRREDFIQRLNIDYVCGASPDELPQHASAIMECVVKSVRAFLFAAQGLKTHTTSERVRRIIDRVEQHLSWATDTTHSSNRPPTPDSANEHISTLAREFSLLGDAIGRVYHDLLSGLRPSEAYFLANLPRLTSPTFTPTHLDVAHSFTHKTALSTSRFDRRSSRRHLAATGHRTTTFRLVNMDTTPLPPSPSPSPFTYSLFLVDLSRYDDPSNPVLRTLGRVKAHVTTTHPSRPLVIILHNVDLLQAKLKRGVPLRTNFPAYRDGWRTDDASAVIFFEGLFRQAAKQEGEGAGGEGEWLVDVLKVRSGEAGVLGRVTDARRWDGGEVRAREVVFGLQSEGVL
ncbi:hypothetical protein B0T18DRAFT_3299 [Schizothecium vesticola]|uniref:Uncharacterized protein n=1 Tax=Schizothecium vesticola TaxID=314040 RepID=A0AA40F7W3_9PEZI|nr:hypothetical protein B0T18DRAFT_3299 [Schizothecium vesticola]